MMFYMGELWDIDYYLPPGKAGRFENIRGDGIEMGLFKISRLMLIPFNEKFVFPDSYIYRSGRIPFWRPPSVRDNKTGMRLFLQQHQVWENNPLQPYQLVAPW